MMAKFTCARYPQLAVRRRGARVRFQGGTLDVDGMFVDAIRGIADRYGIVEVKPGPTPAKPEESEPESAKPAPKPKPEPKPRQPRARRDEPASSD